MGSPHGTVWQQNISTDNIWHSKHLHFKKMTSWFTQVSVLQWLPPTAEQEGADDPQEGMVRELGAEQGFLAKGSSSTWESRSPQNELHVLFQQYWNKQCSQNGFPFLWSLQWITLKAEDGSLLWGEVSRQGYPGTLGSGSRVLLKAMFLQNISAWKN